MTYFGSRKALDRLLRSAGFESWTVHALQLRRHARVIHDLREFPLRHLRRLRRRKEQRPTLAYERSWAFQHEKQLLPYKFLLHGVWTSLFALLRMGGDCFERTPLGSEILNRNLLLVARR